MGICNTPSARFLFSDKLCFLIWIVETLTTIENVFIKNTLSIAADISGRNKVKLFWADMIVELKHLFHAGDICAECVFPYFFRKRIRTCHMPNFIHTMIDKSFVLIRYKPKAVLCDITCHNAIGIFEIFCLWIKKCKKLVDSLVRRGVPS